MHDSHSGIGINSGISHISAGIGFGIRIKDWGPGIGIGIGIRDSQGGLSFLSLTLHLSYISVESELESESKNFDWNLNRSGIRDFFLESESESEIYKMPVSESESESRCARNCASLIHMNKWKYSKWPFMCSFAGKLFNYLDLPRIILFCYRKHGALCLVDLPHRWYITQWWIQNGQIQRSWLYNY